MIRRIPDPFDSIPDECKPPHQRHLGEGGTPTPEPAPGDTGRGRSRVLVPSWVITMILCWSMIVAVAIGLIGSWFGVW